MPFFKIDNVTINGKNQAFGGYIYSVDVEVGLTAKPTQIKINFISATGTYLEPELSVNSSYNIAIGNIINGNFYAITRTFKKTSQGKTLEVIFYDGSIILDRIYVGLYKRHGDDQTNIPGLMIVGHEIHPCDTNDDGVFDGRDSENLLWQQLDPCELRCPSDPLLTEPLLLDCLNKEITDVFEVKYSFRDLLNALKGQVTQLPLRTDVTYPAPADLAAEYVRIDIPLPASKVNLNLNHFNHIKIINVPATLNDFYVQTYVGTLREVLRSWCADFGWSFFWENDGLNFIDTAAQPTIPNFSQAFSNLSELEDTKTLEGTMARGFITRYSEPGIRAKKECSRPQPLVLNCLDLGDLFGLTYQPAYAAVNFQNSTFQVTSDGLYSPPINTSQIPNNADNKIEYIDDIFPTGVDIAAFEESCIMAYYSDVLRHLYNLWNYYQINSSAAAMQNKNLWLDRLGQMKILTVMSLDSGPTQLAKYQILKDGTWGDSKNKFLSDDERKHLQDNNGYFVVVQRNKTQNDTNDLLDVQHKVEEHLATDFMGKHWVKPYASPYYGETPQITPNGQYFGALSSNIRDIPFANFGHSYNSYVSTIVSTYSQTQSNNFRQYDHKRYTQDFNNTPTQKIVRSFVYFQKETENVWRPLKNTLTDLSSLLIDITPKMFKKIDISSLSDLAKKALCTDEDKSVNIDDSLLSNVELYIFYPGTLNVAHDLIDNPNEENIIHLEDVPPLALASAGLLSKKCVRFTVQGVQIYTPGGASVKFERPADFEFQPRDAQVDDFSVPTYKVFATSTAKNRGIILKQEAVFVDAPNLGNTLKTDFQQKELTRDSTKYVNQLMPTCLVNPILISELNEKYSQNLNYSLENPFQSFTYKMMGLKIPFPISIGNGLENISVSVSSEGVFTELKIGNELFTPPNPDVNERAIEYRVDVRSINSRVNPIT